MLSESAADLLRLNLESPVPVRDENRQAYTELAEAGVMEPLHTPKGRDSPYRFTREGWERREEYAHDKRAG